ncbi:stage II sporulation protein M [Cellulomonas sp. PhB143]|uniref:stage II sporulation protein M n=1 Tax=Cellulomonas sp. PhB143 TaxID=2485186 RepID=UPI000F48B5BF|nr:stage II sporulation protein M [Cellulomonas sp. PhB143]ROS78525.1 putative membrane protein SpoIIM required for sporulation [Cellulomonas sp. PhB143]
MDLDAYTSVHRAEWDRLRTLVRRSRLDGAEADELVALYQVVATHLSTVRSAAPDPELVGELSDVLGRARARIAGAHEPAWRDVGRFVLVSLPAALYRIRWWTWGVTAACVLVAVVAGVWVATAPGGLEVFGPASAQEEYVRHAFSEYYDPGTGFALTVWTNNAWIAAQCVALGITGIGPAYVLFQNSVSIGAAGGLMAAHGEADVFFSLILPHGMLELTAVFVAGAAGLRIFWTLVDPGPRPRGRALAAEGRALFSVAVGLVGVLAVSGLIEGFVTGSGLAWWLKIAIGALALAAFWTWVIVLGGRAVAAGETGDLTRDQAGDEAPVAA